MLTARTDQRVLGYLGRALSLELSAVQLYSTQAKLVTCWGMADAAARFSEEAREELGHADRLIERMLAIGVAPNASQLRPVKLGRSLGDLLRINMTFEQELVELYHNAAHHCARTGFHDDRLLFEGLLGEEREHFDQLVTWLREIEGTEPVPRRATRSI